MHALIRPASMLAAVLIAATLHPGRAAAQPPAPTHSGLVYAVLGGRPLRLDLYLPTTTLMTPRPCVVWIHGGGWQGGTRANVPAGAFRLLDQGIAIASVDYRLTSQAALFGGLPVIFPAQIEDVKGAVRWLRANAETYSLDPSRFGAWGSSAGGHLAALLGTSGHVAALEGTTGGNLGESSSVLAFADYFGPTDILHISDMITTPPGSTLDHDAYTSPESRLVGWDDPGQGLGDIKANLTNPSAPYPQLVQLCLLIDPITHLTPDDPPAYIAHGTMDTTVPIGQSVALATAMDGAGLDATYRPVTGAGHGFLGAVTDSLAVAFFVGVLAPGADVGPTPTRAALHAMPNPARGAVTFTRAGGFAPGERIAVLDLAGRTVRTLIAAGGPVVWDGRDTRGDAVPAGLYLARANGVASVTRLVRLP